MSEKRVFTPEEVAQLPAAPVATPPNAPTSKKIFTPEEVAQLPAPVDEQIVEGIDKAIWETRKAASMFAQSLRNIYDDSVKDEAFDSLEDVKKQEKIEREFYQNVQTSGVPFPQQRGGQFYTGASSPLADLLKKPKTADQVELERDKKLVDEALTPGEKMFGVRQEFPKPASKLYKNLKSVASDIVKDGLLAEANLELYLRNIAPEHREAFGRILYETADQQGNLKYKGTIGKFFRGLLEGTEGTFRDLTYAGKMAVDAIRGDEWREYGEKNPGSPIQAMIPSWMKSNDMQQFREYAEQSLKSGDSIDLNLDKGLWGWMQKQAINTGRMAPPFLFSLGLSGATTAATATKIGKLAVGGKQAAFWTAMIYPQEFKKLLAKGVPEEEAARIGFTSAFAQSVVELLQLNPLRVGNAKGLIGRGLGFGRRTLEEAAEEVIQEAISAEAEKAATGEPVKNLGERLRTAFFDSLVPIAIMGAPTGAFELTKGLAEDKESGEAFLSEYKHTNKLRNLLKEESWTRKHIKWLEKEGVVAKGEFTNKRDRDNLRNFVQQFEEENPGQPLPTGVAFQETFDDIKAQGLLEAEEEAATTEQATAEQIEAFKAEQEVKKAQNARAAEINKRIDDEAIAQEKVKVREDFLRFVDTLSENDPKKAKLMLQTANLQAATFDMTLEEYLSEQYIKGFGVPGYDPGPEGVLKQQKLKQMPEVLVELPNEEQIVAVKEEDAELPAGTKVVEELGNQGATDEVASLRSLQQKEPESQGQITFFTDGTAYIQAFEKGDVSTFLHEMAHFYRKMMELDHSRHKREGRPGKTRLEIAAEFAGVKNVESSDSDGWNEAAEEKIARGFEKYMATSEAPTPELKSMFDQFKNWMSNIYQMIVGTDLDIKLTPEMKKVYDSWFLPQQAQQAVAEAEAKQAAIAEQTTAEPRGPPADQPYDVAPEPLPQEGYPYETVNAPAWMDYGDDATSGRNAMNEAQREQIIKFMRKGEIPSPEQETFEQWLDEAMRSGMVENVDALASDILKGFANAQLEPVRQAAFIVRIAQLKNQHAAIMDRIAQVTDGFELAEQSRLAAEVERAYDNVIRANRIAGTETARALVARKLTIDADMNLLPVLQRARAAKGGNLTAAQEATFKELTDRLKAMEEKLAEMEKKQKRKVANRQIKAQKRGVRTPGQSKEAAEKNYRGLVNKIKDLMGAGCLNGY